LVIWIFVINFFLNAKYSEFIYYKISFVLMRRKYLGVLHEPEHDRKKKHREKVLLEQISLSCFCLGMLQN
jgi:hypothetical protein